MKYEPPLQNLLKAAGGPTAVAKLLDIVPSAVTNWRRVPLKHVVKLSEATGLARHELRPDFWEPQA